WRTRYFTVSYGAHKSLGRYANVECGDVTLLPFCGQDPRIQKSADPFQHHDSDTLQASLPGRHVPCQRVAAAKHSPQGDASDCVARVVSGPGSNCLRSCNFLHLDYE